MADEQNPFSINVRGATDLVENPTNKVTTGQGSSAEGVQGEKFDVLTVTAQDADLLKLRDDYEKRYAPYESKLKPRVAKIKESYIGKRPQGQWLVDSELPIAANLQFESEETFLAAALAKNPAPVVWSTNTPEGNAIAGTVKTMLQYHADQLVLRRKLTLMTRQWSMYLLGVLKPGWNSRIKDVAIDNRKVQDYLFDPDGYVDAYGDFIGWLGERITVTAEQLIEEFSEHKVYITESVEGKLGTQVTYTEWWPNDDFCFYTYKDKVLDKHKNQYFKYAETQTVMGQQTVTPARNHFAHPKKPAIFLSVYSLQEQPHDITSLAEQNIPNQNRITRRTDQVDFNASTANNSYAFSQNNFTQETAKQAAQARAKGNPILVPSGGPIDRAILPLPAQDLPNGIFAELENAKNDLRTSWGVQGITAQPQDEDQTARGMILNQAHDTSRIGGGIGEAIEQVADNAFNWLTQLYYVFYDEEHFAAVMGNAKAVEYVTLINSQLNVPLIVSVAPDSMKPKDEVSNLNMAQALYDKGAIGPKTLLKMIDFPDPEEAAADGVLYKLDPASYFRLNFPEYAERLAQMQAVTAQTAMGAVNPTLGQNISATAPEAITEPEGNLSRPQSSPALANVPITA